ncbi:MAG: phosphate ABC transporter, permease protein PstA, partial [Verrucomicrobiota bacterium]
MAHKFEKKWTAAKRQEQLVSWVFRVAAYFILLCVTWIFVDITLKGSSVLIQPEAPFINIEFLTEAPETLHVFEY